MCRLRQLRWSAWALVFLLSPVHAAEQSPAAKDRSIDRSEGQTSVAAAQVFGRLTSDAYARMGGRIERTIVRATALATGKLVVDELCPQHIFQFSLPPGRYSIVFSANGSRGATFEVAKREVEIRPGQMQIDLGTIDLPISRTTSLYGQPAPEWDGIVGWKNTPPLTLAQLRGKVVLLDFFAYYCSICHAHKPDLARLYEKYREQGLAVVALHEEKLASMAEFDEKMDPIFQRVFKGKVPQLPMALDGPQGVFQRYGIHAVPAMILIDRQGRVVRRFHHAGVPELEGEIVRLLATDQGASNR